MIHHTHSCSLFASLLLTVFLSGCDSSENEKVAKINYKVETAPAVPAREAKQKNLTGSAREQHKNYPTPNSR